MINQFNNYMPKIGIEELNYNSENILRMHFLNGSIDIIEKQYGAYAICPGCGSGKTTNIKNLIALRWYEGILYAAFTKNELNEMYQFCKTLVGSVYQNNMTGEYYELKSDDILVLHSDFSAEGTDNNLWRNKPEELASKRIILCTHHKLLNEPLHLLINSNFNITTANLISPLRAAVNGSTNSTLPRQWILIDESTEARPLTSKIRKEALYGLGVMNDMERVVEYDENRGYPIYVSKKLEMPRFIKSAVIYKDFKTQLQWVSRMSSSFNSVYRKESCELDKLRNEQFCQSMYYNYEKYANMDNDYVNVSFSYTDLVNPDMKTHLLLFDGTSDVTLRNSSIYLLQSYPDKYNGRTNMYEFSFNLSRKIKYDGTNLDVELRSKLDKVANDLESIIRQNQKTLIFTWRNFKTDNSEVNDDVDDGLIAQNGCSVNINDKFNIPSYLSMRLNEKGLMEGVNYSIEYYGSGKDKATNQFREYDSVVLLGKYNVPSNVIDDFNIMNHCNMSSTEYYANRVIQAICRSRIRLHNRKDINVYMSNDWSRDVINYVDSYMNNGRITLVFNTPDAQFVDEAYTRLRAVGITPKKAEQIAKISQLDRNILLCIETKRAYKTTVTLSDLYSVLPMSRKVTEQYRRVISTFEKLGIELGIQS